MERFDYLYLVQILDTRNPGFRIETIMRQFPF